jgi:negative regulator of replication initiation
MDKPGKPTRKFVGVWMDEALYNYIQEQAVELKDTQSNVVRTLLLIAQRTKTDDKLQARIEALEVRFDRHIAAHQKGVAR